MILPAYINVNINGIPAISSQSVTVTATEVKFDFLNHRNVGLPFRGLIIVRFNQLIPTGTTGTLPIVFTTEGGNAQNLIDNVGANVTASDITGIGIRLCWFESSTNTLQLIA